MRKKEFSRLLRYNGSHWTSTELLLPVGMISMPLSNDELWGERPFSQLLQHARLGSIEARNELFTQIRAYLTFVAVQEHHPRRGAKGSVSDIVQQTLLSATQEFQQFQGDSEYQFRHWLRRILLNLSNDHYRYVTAKRRDVRLEQPLATGDSTTLCVQPIDPHLTPCSEALSSEQIAVIQRSMAKLPSDLRQVLYLRNWERLSFSEIAAKIGVTTSVAAKLWYRALVELKQVYDQTEI